MRSLLALRATRGGLYALRASVLIAVTSVRLSREVSKRSVTSPASHTEVETALTRGSLEDRDVLAAAGKRGQLVAVGCGLADFLLQRAGSLGG